MLLPSYHPNLSFCSILVDVGDVAMWWSCLCGCHICVVAMFLWFLHLCGCHVCVKNRFSRANSIFSIPPLILARINRNITGIDRDYPHFGYILLFYFRQILELGSWPKGYNIQNLIYKEKAVLYPPWDNPYGIHGMGDRFHELGDGLHTFLRWIPWNGGWIIGDGLHTFIRWMGDGFHIFFTIFTSPHLNPCGLNAFENLVKLDIDNVFNRTTYINLL